MHSRFAALLWSIFASPCRDLNELRHLSHLLFPIYCAPVRRGEIAADNAAALYRAISPHLQQQLRRLYLRETTSTEWEKHVSEVRQMLHHALI
jgi:origin recognition complex subunit 5